MFSFCYVDLSTPASAEKIASINGKPFGENVLTVEIARARADKGKPEVGKSPAAKSPGGFEDKGAGLWSALCSGDLVI